MHFKFYIVYFYLFRRGFLAGIFLVISQEILWTIVVFWCKQSWFRVINCTLAEGIVFERFHEFLWAINFPKLWDRNSVVSVASSGLGHIFLQFQFPCRYQFSVFQNWPAYFHSTLLSMLLIMGIVELYGVW